MHRLFIEVQREEAGEGGGEEVGGEGGEEVGGGGPLFGDTSLPRRG